MRSMSGPAPETARSTTGRVVLKRQLRLIETIAVSIAIVAPTLAMSATPGAAAGLVGSAVVLPFLFAFGSIALVAWSFVRLSSRYASAGSVYAFTGLTLGPRSGFFSGWALLGAYLGGVGASSAVGAAFAEDLLHQLGVAGSIPWIAFALPAVLGAGLLAMRSVRFVTRSLLVIECASVALIVVLMVIIAVRVAGGYHPLGSASVADVIKPHDHLGFSAIALAAVFAFMAFLGFEGAGSVGEEAGNPRSTVPRAILLAVAGAGALFIVCAVVQSIGFGSGAAGLDAFTSSSSAFADLGRLYSGRAMATVIDVGAAASGFSAALAQVVAASRLMYAVSRDAEVVAPLARLSPRSNEPRNAVMLTCGVGLSVILGLFIAGVSAQHAFLYIGSFQVLVVIVAYAMTSVGAGWMLGIRERSVHRLELLIPTAAVACLGYTLYRQIAPAPAPPFNVIPWIALAWLVTGATVSVASPSLARRIGAGLVSSQEPAGRHLGDPIDDRDDRQPALSQAGLTASQAGEV